MLKGQTMIMLIVAVLGVLMGLMGYVLGCANGYAHGKCEVAGDVEQYWEGFGAGIDASMGDMLQAYAIGFSDGELVTKTAYAIESDVKSDTFIEEAYQKAKAVYLAADH
jgi:hypothetical protein